MTEHLQATDAPKSSFDRLDWNKLGWGLALVVLGLLFALDRFTSIDGFFRLWPMVLAVVGLARLVSAKNRDQACTGLWLLGAASWFLINFFGIAGFHWANSWPLWVIMTGIIYLIVPKKTESRWEALVPLGIGIWLLMVVRGVAGLDWSNSWPLILIFVGLSIVIKALVPKSVGAKEKSNEN